MNWYKARLVSLDLLLHAKEIKLGGVKLQDYHMSRHSHVSLSLDNSVNIFSVYHAQHPVTKHPRCCGLCHDEHQVKKLQMKHWIDKLMWCIAFNTIDTTKSSFATNGHQLPLLTFVHFVIFFQQNHLNSYALKLYSFLFYMSFKSSMYCKKLLSAISSLAKLTRHIKQFIAFTEIFQRW